MPETANSYQVLANDEKVQAVKLKNGVIMAIFHKHGRIADLASDSAGAFIITEDKIFAADPTQKKRIFNVSLNKKAYKIALPGRKFSGQTIAIAR